MLTTKASAEHLAHIAHRGRMIAIGAPTDREEYDRQVVRLIVDALDGLSRPISVHEHDAPGMCADCDATVVLTFFEAGDVELIDRWLRETR